MLNILRHGFALAVSLMSLCGPGLAQSDAVPASGLTASLTLDHPAPWRIQEGDDPTDLVLHLRGIPPEALDLSTLRAASPVADIAASQDEGGWTRVHISWRGAFSVERAGMDTGLENGRARISLSLAKTKMPEATALPEALLDLARKAPATPPGKTRRIVMIDPGHGGVDPGAVRDGHHEADITLAFSRVLRATLLDVTEGALDIRMTRDDDVFVSLEGRIAAAQRAGADLFISIHADAVAEGIARGAQVYTLSEAASSRAAAQLAERHNRSDLLAGIDLADQDDLIASVLMDMARRETEPRTEALADTLVDALRDANIRLHARPREKAAFAVLKSPDIPSVLVEIGFMSSPGELEKLLSPEWQEKVAAAMTSGILSWARDDTLRAGMVLQ